MRDLLLFAVISCAFVFCGTTEIPADKIGGDITTSIGKCNTNGLKDTICSSSCPLIKKKCKQPNPGVRQTKVCDANNGAIACFSTNQNCNGIGNHDVIAPDKCTEKTSDASVPRGF